MCGRFTLKAAAMSLQELFDLSQCPSLPPRFNIAPTQNIAAVRAVAAKAGRELALLRWGLIPSWAKDAKIGNRLINARSDTVAKKPSFRSAFRRRRCLVAADGYYEWIKSGSKKQPYHIRMAHGGPFAIAGLWEHWEGEDGEVIDSCTLLTTEANELMKPLHDRMPVILPREAFAQWLDPAEENSGGLQALLKPYPSEGMTACAVSTVVNNARVDDPRCVEPLA